MTREDIAKTIKPSRWRPRRRTVAGAGLLILLAIISVNAIAIMQARAMTQFISGGDRNLPPEALNLVGKIHVIVTGVRIPRPENHSTPADIGAEFETFRFGGTDGKELEGWHVPAEHPKGMCLLFHAYVATKSAVLPLAREFHALGYDVVMIDFHGCGGSRGNTTTLGYAEANDVALTVAYAEQRWHPQPLILYGQSMGSAAILRAIAECNVHPSGIIIESAYDRMLSAVENRFGAMGLPSFPLANLLTFWGGELRGYNAFAMNPDEFASKVLCPVLMFHAGKDLRVTNAQARNLFDHFAGPKQFELFEHSGHCGFLPDDKPRWTAAVKGFLSTFAAQ